MKWSKCKFLNRLFKCHWLNQIFLLSVWKNEEIVKRDDLLSRLSSLENAVENHAETVQGYEKVIRSLEMEKATLLASIGDREEDILKILELKRQIDEFSIVVEERDSLKEEIERLRINGEAVSGLQGCLLEAEKTKEEFDSVFIRFTEEKKKNDEYQVALSDLMIRFQDLEDELIVKNERIISQEIQLEEEKVRSQHLEHALSTSGDKILYVVIIFLYI